MILMSFPAQTTLGFYADFAVSESKYKSHLLQGCEVSSASVLLLSALPGNTLCFGDWVSQEVFSLKSSCWMIWNLKSNPNSQCVGFIIHPLTLCSDGTLSNSQTIPLQFPVSWQMQGAGALQAQSPGAVLGFVVCTRQELGTAIRKWRRLEWKESLSVKTNRSRAHAPSDDTLQWRGMSCLTGKQKSCSRFMKGDWKTPTQPNWWVK